MTFDEDRAQIRSGHAQRKLAIVRNLVIALIRLLDVRWMPQGQRHFGRRSSLALSAVRLKSLSTRPRHYSPQGLQRGLEAALASVGTLPRQALFCPRGQR